MRDGDQAASAGETVRDELYVDGRGCRRRATGADRGHRPDDGAADGLGAGRQRRRRGVGGSGGQAALAGWSQLAPADRGRYLSAIADGLERRADELAELIALEVGMPEDQCIDDQIPIVDFRVNAELAAELPVRGEVATAPWCCASRSAWSPRSRRGTIRSVRSRPRSHRRWRRAARSWSSRPRSLR